MCGWPIQLGRATARCSRSSAPRSWSTCRALLRRPDRAAGGQPHRAGAPARDPSGRPAQLAVRARSPQRAAGHAGDPPAADRRCLDPLSRSRQRPTSRAEPRPGHRQHRWSGRWHAPWTRPARSPGEPLELKLTGPPLAQLEGAAEPYPLAVDLKLGESDLAGDVELDSRRGRAGGPGEAALGPGRFRPTAGWAPADAAGAAGDQAAAPSSRRPERARGSIPERAAGRLRQLPTRCRLDYRSGSLDGPDLKLQDVALKAGLHDRLPSARARAATAASRASRSRSTSRPGRPKTREQPQPATASTPRSRRGRPGSRRSARSTSRRACKASCRVRGQQRRPRRDPAPARDRPAGAAGAAGSGPADPRRQGLAAERPAREGRRERSVGPAQRRPVGAAALDPRRSALGTAVGRGPDARTADDAGSDGDGRRGVGEGADHHRVRDRPRGFAGRRCRSQLRGCRRGSARGRVRSAAGSTSSSATGSRLSMRPARAGFATTSR